MKTTTLKVGDKIKSFEVKSIVNGLGKRYTSNGKKKFYDTQ
jgi:hypothetical protein